MNSVYLVELKYVADYRVFLRFNTGESGEVDLKDLVFKYEAAKPLRDPKHFAQFFWIRGRRWPGSADLMLPLNPYTID